MNTMLDPRMVAARIHGPEALVQGAAATPDAITPSSHGCRRMLAMSLVIIARKGSSSNGTAVGSWLRSSRLLAGDYRSLLALCLPGHSRLSHSVCRDQCGGTTLDHL